MVWESTAALYGCENILPTSWQRGSPDFFFCCCCWIMAGRNGEVLLSELRCLTLIRRLILLNLRQTSLQQHGDIFVKGGFLGTVQPIWLTWNVKHLSSVHIIFYACRIYLPPHLSLHSSCISGFRIPYFCMPSSIQHKERLCFSLLSPLCPMLSEDTNHKQQGGNTQDCSGNRFYRAGPNKWGLHVRWLSFKERVEAAVHISKPAGLSLLHHRDLWRCRKHAALKENCAWILPATQRPSPWSHSTCCDLWSSKDMRGWKEDVRSPTLKTFIIMSKPVKLWF